MMSCRSLTCWPGPTFTPVEASLEDAYFAAIGGHLRPDQVADRGDRFVVTPRKEQQAAERPIVERPAIGWAAPRRASQVQERAVQVSRGDGGACGVLVEHVHEHSHLEGRLRGL